MRRKIGFFMRSNVAKINHIFVVFALFLGVLTAPAFAAQQCQVGKYWSPTSLTHMPCQEGFYCPGTGTNADGNKSCEKNCPGFLPWSDVGATSISECYGDMDPGLYVEVTNSDPDNFEHILEMCPEGYYCPGGQEVTFAEFSDPDFYSSKLKVKCPAGTTSEGESYEIEQCCNATTGQCGGDVTSIYFSYDTSQVERVIPSLYGNNWYYRQVYGIGYNLVMNGSAAGTIEQFPVPVYKSSSGITFMGWYTEPNGGGTRIVGPTGTPMPSNTYFGKNTVTLYAYEKTNSNCREGKAYVLATDTFIDCPEGYYCTGWDTIEDSSVVDGKACMEPCPSIGTGSCPADKVCISLPFTSPKGSVYADQCTATLPDGYGFSNVTAAYVYQCPNGYFRGVDDYTTGSDGSAWVNGKIKDGLATPVIITRSDLINHNEPDNINCQECAYLAYTDRPLGACKAPDPGYRTTGCSDGGPGFLDCTGQEPCMAGTYLKQFSGLNVGNYGPRGKECVPVSAGAYPTDCFGVDANGDPNACISQAACPSGDNYVTSPAGATSGQACCKPGFVWDPTRFECARRYRIDFSFDRNSVSSIAPSISAISWDFHFVADLGERKYYLYFNDNMDSSGYMNSFPVLYYKSELGQDFGGWYTEPNGKGVQVSDGEGNILVDIDFFDSARTLYPLAYKKCQPGKAYVFATKSFMSCPKGYYCSGEGMAATSSAQPLSCAVACPKMPICDSNKEDCSGTASLTTASTGATSLAQCTYELAVGYGYSSGSATQDAYIYKCPAGYFRGVDKSHNGANGLAWVNGEIKDGLITPVIITGEDVENHKSVNNSYCGECEYLAYAAEGEGACHAPDPGFRSTGCSNNGPGFLDCKGQEACPAGTYLKQFSGFEGTIDVGTYGPRGKECVQISAGSYPTECFGTEENGNPNACISQAACPTGDNYVTSPAGATSGQACCATGYSWDGDECVRLTEINFNYSKQDVIRIVPSISASSHIRVLLKNGVYYLYIDGRNVGNIFDFPYPVYSSGTVFGGWYTEPDGKGVRIADEQGIMLVEPSFFEIGERQLYALELKQCPAGISQIKTSNGVTVALYDKKATSPALAVGYAGQVCYGVLEPGSTSGAINLRAAGVAYHTKSGL